MVVDKVSGVPFSKFLYVTFIGHFTFAVPAVIAVILLNLIKVKPLLFILLPMALISIPISAVLTWLFAKGSNWVNTLGAISVTCSFPGRFYAVFLGGLLGFRVFNVAGGIIFAILLYLGVALTTRPFGRFLIRRFVPEIVV
jgi:hypothetical protein